VVANESCASGVPVVVTPHAGVAGELVVDGDSGFVRPLDVDGWAEACVKLLTDSALYDSMAARCRQLVQSYTFENAAQGLMDGIRLAL
jgi:glycosyltransferase involved in cell wall biosynthesis